ncbi:MAG: alkaline phosphatase family protein [Prevotella sp.]
MNKYISAFLLGIVCVTPVCGQTLQPAPRLVVNIIIDQLRTDYIEHYSPLYTEKGFRKLLQEGRVYEAARYSFSPVDHASAIASIVTGTTPFYNDIVGAQWLDRNTLRTVGCTDDEKAGTSPQKMSTSTIGDELKVATNGSAIVYAIATEKDAAVLLGGHAADGAFWKNSQTGNWTTSGYYPETSFRYIKAYNVLQGGSLGNESVVNLAINCITNHAMGRDDATDMMSIVLSATVNEQDEGHSEMENVYLQLDKILAELVEKVEENVGKEKVLFVLTSTGATDSKTVDYSKFRIPTGTFYINRTANLLNMYLVAIYGQGQYVETCYHNQIYLNRKLIEQRHISLSDVISRSQELLILNSGVRGVHTSPYNPSVSGDLLIEVAPGWNLFNEDTGEQYMCRTSFVPFPIIFYGANVECGRITTPVAVDCIAPTIAKAIRIRAPNACPAEPLP